MLPRHPASPLFPYTTLFRSPVLDLGMESERGLDRGLGVELGREGDLEQDVLDHVGAERLRQGDRKSARLNSSHEWISYAVFCLKKKINNENTNYPRACTGRH